MRKSSGTYIGSVVLSDTPYVGGTLARELPARADARAGGLVVVNGGCAARPTTERVRRATAAVNDALLGARELMLAALVVLLCVSVLAAWGISGHRSTAAALSEVPFECVSVAQGESLWEISEAHPVAGLTTQQVVSLISERNDLAGTLIQPGQILLVPAGA